MRHRRDGAIVRVMLETGLQAGEVVALQVDDADLAAGTLTVRRGKGDKGRVVPIGREASLALDRYLRLRRSPPRHEPGHRSDSGMCGRFGTRCAPRSELSPHHWSGGCRPPDFDESCGGEHGHRACVDRGTAHFRGLQRVDIDRMALNSRSAVITSELHVGPQERTADTGTSMAAVDGETRDPPDAVVQVGQHPREGSIAAHAGERVPWPHPAPPDWPVVDVSDDTGWHASITDLLLQCGSVVERPGRVDH